MKFVWKPEEIAKLNPVGVGLFRVRLTSIESKRNKDNTGVNWMYEFVVDEGDKSSNTGRSLTLIRPMAYPGLHADMHAALFGIDKSDFAEKSEYDSEDLIGLCAYVEMRKALDRKTQEQVLRDVNWFKDGDRPILDIDEDDNDDND